MNTRKRHHPRRARHRSGRLVRRLPDGAPLDSTAPRTRCRTAPDSPAAGSPAPTGPPRSPRLGQRPGPCPQIAAVSSRNMPDDDREQPAGSRRNRRTRPAGHDPQTRPDCDDRIEHTAADQHLWEALNRARADYAPGFSPPPRTLARALARPPGQWIRSRPNRPRKSAWPRRYWPETRRQRIPGAHPALPSDPNSTASPPPEPSCMGRGHPPGGRHTTGSGVVSR